VGFEGQAASPYAPPSAVGDEPVAIGIGERPLEGAGFAIRAAARIADSFVHIAVSALAGVIGAIVLGLLAREGIVHHGWQGKIRGLSALGMGAGLTATLLLHVISEGVAGATPGKYLCGLRVALEDGRRCTGKAALIRSLSYFVDALFCGLIAYHAMQSSPLNQRFGDRWAHTVVIKARALPAGSAARSGPFAVAWTSAIFLNIVIQALALVLKAL
jgi:uncharacterized RDD family membrane protein YckC